MELKDLIKQELSDEELQTYQALMEARISQQIGIPISPKKYTIIEHINSDKYLVDMYPITEVTEVTVDNHTLTTEDYKVDKESGIIYFLHKQRGLLEMEYYAGFDESLYSMYIFPLIVDMINYEVQDDTRKNVSSIKEADLQITYDTSNSESAHIQEQLANLKSLFNTYCRMI